MRDGAIIGGNLSRLQENADKREPAAPATEKVKSLLGLRAASTTRHMTVFITTGDDSPSPIRFSSAIDAILAAAPPMPLDAGTVDAARAERIRSLDAAGIGHGPA